MDGGQLTGRPAEAVPSAALSGRGSPLEERWFVGRERELAVFEQWLTTATPVPAVLTVTGRGGVGKSSLLRAFARRAGALGRSVVAIDCRDIPRTPEGLLSALAPLCADAVASLNETLPLILLDVCEQLGPLERSLHEQLLPRLDPHARVVLADRQPVPASWRGDTPPGYLVRTLPMHSFTELESSEYLHRRGIDDRALVEEAWRAARGNPLALALAADLIADFGIRHLDAAPEWRLALRSLIERLLRDAQTQGLRALLEASVVVRQFDEATLAALVARGHQGDAFADLCRLSAVRPAEHGLRLHDDVRCALTDDLSWRAPERYRALRLRALAHLHERARTAPAEERAWLVAERLFLAQNVFLQAMLFSEDESEDLWVEPARPEEREQLPRLWQTFLLLTGSEFGLHGDDDPLLDYFLEAARPVFLHPAARLRVARDREGRVLACSVAMPICQETLPMMRAQASFGPVLEAWWGSTNPESLPAAPQAASAYYLITIAHGAERAEAARAALMRDMAGLFAQGGTYFVSSVFPSINAFFEACGFTDVTVNRTTLPAGLTMRDLVLDLTRIGVDTWLEALVRGRPAPRVLSRESLGLTLRTTLSHWHDDAWLAESPLLQHPGVIRAGTEPGPATLRHVIRQALARARARSRDEQALACDALELAYIDHQVSYERAAERLAVSRRTFYRLLQRGVRDLAAALDDL